jgi:hypothetical protein
MDYKTNNMNTDREKGVGTKRATGSLIKLIDEKLEVIIKYLFKSGRMKISLYIWFVPMSIR